MEFRDMRAEYFDAMLRAKKGYSRILDPICKQWNITRNELDVMLFLANNPGFDRAADIVSRRGLAKSHVSLSVSNLEARGLLTRHCDPGDRRTVHLKLTEQAVAIAKEGREAQVSYFSRIYAGLSAEEVEIWQNIMLKLVKNIAHMNIAL